MLCTCGGGYRDYRKAGHTVRLSAILKSTDKKRIHRYIHITNAKLTAGLRSVANKSRTKNTLETI